LPTRIMCAKSISARVCIFSPARLENPDHIPAGVAQFRHGMNSEFDFRRAIQVVRAENESEAGGVRSGGEGIEASDRRSADPGSGGLRVWCRGSGADCRGGRRGLAGFTLSRKGAPLNSSGAGDVSPLRIWHSGDSRPPLRRKPTESGSARNAMRDGGAASNVGLTSPPRAGTGRGPSRRR